MNENQRLSIRRPLYLAYLVRLWQVKDTQPIWRASLRSVQGSQQRGFKSLEALFEYLREETQGRGNRERP